MSNTDFIGFECDYSDRGTLTLSLEQPVPGKRKADGTPVTQTITLLVPLWLAIRLDSGGNEEIVNGQYFVSCRSKQGSTAEFFIAKEDFEARMPLSNSTAYFDVYRKDWQSAVKDDSLACVGYDDDGLLLGSKGARSWPRAGLIASLPRRGTDQEKEKARLQTQTAIWLDIATTSTSAGASRLWKPSSWTGDPLHIYFLPCQKSSWPSRSTLQAIVDAIRKDEEEKASKASARRLPLIKWLRWEVPGADFVAADYVHLSTNLLRLYDTFISKKDLVRLVHAQTEGGTDWRRPWPLETEARAVHDQMLTNLKRTKKSYWDLMKGGLKEQTVAQILSTKTFGKRIDANKIMGSKSANQLGKDWWHDGDAGPTVVAEWLHRSAYSLGDLKAANFQSPDNIVFGTFEANSDMTRAETAIRTLRDVAGAEGSLTTTVKTANLPAGDSLRLTYIDANTGNLEPWLISDWIDSAKFTWMAPSIEYVGHMDVKRSSTPVQLVWATRFHPFSRYSPLILEGKLDSRILAAYLKTTNSSPGAPSSSNQRTTSGPSASTALATTSVRTLLVAHSGLGSSEPSARPLAARDILKLNSNAPIRRKRDLGAISAHAYSVRNSGVLATHPTVHTAWQSIVKNAPSVVLAGPGDIRLESPRLADDGNDIGEPTDTPPSTGFMLEGTIKLFGLEQLQVPLQSWHGPPPPGVIVGTDVPVYQRVRLTESVHFSDFIPLIEGTPLAELEVRNVSITYQNYQFVQTMLPGWTITADIDIDEKSSALHQILHDVMGFSGSDLQAHASLYLGLGHSWTSRPRVSNFVATGVLDVASRQNTIGQDPSQPSGVQLCTGVVLSRVGVSVYAVSVPTLGMHSTEHTHYGFKIFGDMHIAVPGSVTPLDLDFAISEFGGVAVLDATVKGGLWKNAFGTGIDLDMVQLSASFPLASLTDLTCSVRAHLQAGSASALITGTFTVGGNYSLAAAVENFGAQGVVDLFRHYAGEELALPNHVDVTIGSATITITKGNGLEIVVDKLAFDSYEAIRAVVHLSSKGVSVRADVEKIALPGDIGVSLVSGYMEVSFEREDSGKSTDVALGGEVQLDGFPSIPSIKGGVHLYRPSTSKTLEWTLYGTFTDLGNTTTLGKLFPPLEGSFLQDFALQDLMFIAASSDDPLLSHMNPLRYPIKKGVQFSALFGEVVPLNKLLRRPSYPGLLLSASWTGGDSFMLDVVLPTNTLIHLGRGVTTDPITLSIDSKRLLLSIATGVQVPVPKSDIPLDFQAALTLQGELVALEGAMHGLWKDPFALSESVAIGPLLELSLAIDLVEFPETGILRSFSFAGGLAIGKTEGDVAVKISEIPNDELVEGKVKNFGIQDVVAFARDVTQVHIPLPPNFINFEDVKLYISTGVVLAGTVYPAGFSFNAAVVVFGARFHASAGISGGVLSVHGDVDELVVGPLHITGQRGVKPTVDLQVGATAQQLRVDGAMEFLGAHVGLALDLEILPEPTFSFSFQLNFTDLLLFVVDAQMVGKVHDLNDLSSLNFLLHALFEQHLVEYVRTQVLAALKRLKENTDEQIQEAELKVQAEEKKLQDGIDAAQATLTDKYDSWTRHAAEIHKKSQVALDGYTKQRQSLEAGVENARKTFNADMAAAEGKLQHANADRAAKMQDAEAKVTKAKSDWDANVAAAEKDLERAKRNMEEKFGHAVRDIEAARRSVDSLQSQIDSTNRRIRYCEDSPWYRFDLKAEIVWQGTKLLTLEGSKATADGVLWLAEKVVEGTEYVAAKGAIPLAEAAVKEAGVAGDGAFKVAQETLRGVDTATAAVVQEAANVVETVRRGGDELVKGAESALNGFVTANEWVLTAAQQAIDDLIHSAEWLAYKTASTVLDVAKHATHALDVAKAALEAAKQIVDGSITIAEEVVEATLSALDITRIELVAVGLDTFLRGDGFHFEAEVEGVVVGKPFTLQLKLDMRNTAQLINDIFHALIKHMQ